MRQPIACLSLVLAILAAGCGGGSVEGDMKKSGDELRKAASKMSDAELEKRFKETESYAKEFDKEMGDREPDQAQMEKMAKLVEIAGIYATEQMKRQMK